MRTSLLKKLRKKFYSDYKIQPTKKNKGKFAPAPPAFEFSIFRYESEEWRWIGWCNTIEEAENRVRREINRDIRMWIATEKCRRHRWLW